MGPAVTPLLCAALRCRDPRHQPGCDQECAPHPARIAADGLRLCSWHTDRLATDAAQAAQLHAELAERLVGGSGHGEPVSGTHGHDRAPADAVVAMRTEIRHTLMSWVHLVAEERGVTLPDGTRPGRVVKPVNGTPIWQGEADLGTLVAGPPAVTVDQAAAFLATHAPWLAAQEYADEVSGELDSLRRRAWSVCYPRGVRTIPLRVDGKPVQCLEPGCTGTVTARVDGKACRADKPEFELPPELVCDLDPEHRWPPTTWHAFRRAVKARAA